MDRNIKRQKAVIVLPTYNERANIGKLLTSIRNATDSLQSVETHVLVVDDSSPDGTANLVKKDPFFSKTVHLLAGGKKAGLGVAYIKGFQYAIKKLKADIVVEMDADFSHDPKDLPRLYAEIQNGNDFVIGSRYIKGGSIPKEWPLLRKLNSKWGNIFARRVAGIADVKDCTSGFRAINVKLLKKMQLSKLHVKGYAFQISLLVEALNQNARVKEVSIHFVDRVYGQSKISYKDVTEFITYCFTIRLKAMSEYSSIFVYFLAAFIFGFLWLYLLAKGLLTLSLLFFVTFSLLSVLFLGQGLMNLYWMLYIWENPLRMKQTRSPRKYNKPFYSFTALVPARHEQQVIGDTLKAIAGIRYPEKMKEVIVIARTDDRETIQAAEAAIKKLGKSNVRIVTFNDYPINKPHALNVGLAAAKNQVVVIFDAEDEPHKNIYQIANTSMLQKHADVLQSGVQLINYRASWFSMLNVLEYFFWFKSILTLFANNNFIPLGGNTVFFKKTWLKRVKGWDEACLTEDAEIGLRLSQKGATIKVIYDERHTTREETPHSVIGFIQQRTRWKQGFLQILFKGDWLKLPTKTQRLLAGYVFMFPLIELGMALFIPFSVIMIFEIKLPVVLAMLSIMPVYVGILQIAVAILGMNEFTKKYRFKASKFLPLLLLATFIPYLLLLIISVVRAITRLALSKNSWEKTLHINGHRKSINPQSGYAIR